MLHKCLPLSEFLVVALCPERTGQPQRDCFPCQSEIRIILSQEQAVFRPAGKHPVGLRGSMGDQIILKSGVVKPMECLHYALNLPTSVVITGIDSQEILQQAFEAAKTFKPMSKEEVAALLAKTEKVAAAGEYELFKTSAHFDSTAHHPEWLGGQSPHVDKLAGPPS